MIDWRSEQTNKQMGRKQEFHVLSEVVNITEVTEGEAYMTLGIIIFDKKFVYLNIDLWCNWRVQIKLMF